MARARSIFLAVLPLIFLVAVALLLRLTGASERKTEWEPLPARRGGGGPTPYAVSGAAAKPLEAAIQGYIGAIRARKFAQALSFATPTFQQAWTPERFREMILQGYAPLLAARNVTLRDSRVAGDQARIRLVVDGGNGNYFPYEYLLVRLRDRWYVESGVPIDFADLGSATQPSRYLR